jgi:hypothetical protein
MSFVVEVVRRHCHFTPTIHCSHFMIVMVAFQTMFDIPTTRDTCSIAFPLVESVVRLAVDCAAKCARPYGYQAGCAPIPLFPPNPSNHSSRECNQHTAKGVHGTIHDIGLI